MRYVLGVDGGGSKTDMLLCREDGAYCGRTVVGGSNHQLVGMKKAKETLLSGMDKLLKDCGTEKKELAYICLGLSGADFPEDITALERELIPWFGSVPCMVLNDVWLPLEAMVPTGAGAVSICGTGHNTAVRGADESRYQIAALNYELGNWGGGHMMTRHALHAAIRSAEHTGDRTALEDALPAAYGFGSMLEVQKHLYLTGERDIYDVNVPHIVSGLAKDGDAVCIRLLRNDGTTQAEMTAGLLRHAGLLDAELPVVLAGSMYLKDASGIMRDTYGETLSGVCPGARLIELDRPPVIGAVLLSLSSAGMLNDENERRILDYGTRKEQAS